MAKVGDYVILAGSNNKNILVRVCYVSKSSGRMKGTVETKPDTDPLPPFEFKEREVVAYLGHAPVIGNAYGVRIEPQLETIELPYFGDARVFALLDDHVRSALRKAFKILGKTASRLPKIEFDVELRKKQGKMIGKYTYRKNKESDTLALFVEDTLSTVPHAFFHEYAHGIWARLMTPRLRMKWVGLYHKTINTTAVGEKELRQLYKDLLSNGDIRSFYKECEEQDRSTLNAVFRHIKQVHSLSREHIQWAISTEYPFEEMWPTSVELSAKEIMLTEYSLVSPEEFFAEAIALSMNGVKLPSKVKEQVEYTLNKL